MSVLTESLDRILNWLQQHKLEYASSFLPGLSLLNAEKRKGKRGGSQSFSEFNSLRICTIMY